MNNQNRTNTESVTRNLPSTARCLNVVCTILLARALRYSIAVISYSVSVLHQSVLFSISLLLGPARLDRICLSSLISLDSNTHQKHLALLQI